VGINFFFLQFRINLIIYYPKLIWSKNISLGYAWLFFIS